MVSNSLSKAIEMARTLPENEQEELGALLLQEMRSEERWSGVFASSQDVLAKLASEALAEHRAGRTKQWSG